MSVLKNYDPCEGCFGAAMGDCDDCPVMNGDSGKGDVSV